MILLNKKYIIILGGFMIKINMLSKADSVDGQGVGSAYLELINLLKSNKKFNVSINKRGKFDITHVHTVNPTYYFKMNNGVSVCYVHFLPHTLDGSIKLPKPIFKIFKWYVVKFYKKAKHLVVVNPIFINDLERYGIEKERITYIPNYVSKDKFYKKDKKEEEKLKKELKIDKNKFVVLGVGQVQTRKGVMDFVEVAKKCPDIEFIWCGGFSFGAITDGYEELKKVYENPPKNVRFTGIIKRDKMNDMFNIADVLFMPSYNELFPMSILEAVNLNMPLLLRDLDLYEDILFKKYVSGKNNKEFIIKLNELKDNKKLYKEQSENSKYISNYYSKENVSKLWDSFYTNIIKK